MTRDNQARRIVVGYDGSPASRAALARVADHAGAGGKIHVVHAYSLPHGWVGTPDYRRPLDEVAP
jgi:nucleotide-binding universal stress UspA family protein